MEILNDTAMGFAYLPGRVNFPGHSLTVLIKGSFDLVHGDACTLAAEQPFPTGDVPFAEDEDSEYPAAPRYESDFAYTKPRADLLLVGSAHAAHGPVAHFPVTFRVGDHERTLSIIGDRYWAADGQMSDPTPISTLPLHYRYAFGGPGDARNPSGKGAAPVVGGSGQEVWPLPNIEDPSALTRNRADKPQPAGLGPLSRSWALRGGKLGRYDGSYLEKRWPWFPRDFDWGYCNAAPPAMQVEGYLRGDEPLLFENLHARHARYRSQLPGLRVRCFACRALARRKEPRFEEIDLHLDTLWVDMDKEQLVLVWRGWTQVSGEEFPEIQHLYLVCENLTEAAGSLGEWQGRFAARVAEEEARWGPATAAPAAAGDDTTRIKGRDDLARTQVKPGPRPAAEKDITVTRIKPPKSGAADIDATVIKPRPGGPGKDTPDEKELEAELDRLMAEMRADLEAAGIAAEEIPDLGADQKREQVALMKSVGVDWDADSGQFDFSGLDEGALDTQVREALNKLRADLEQAGIDPDDVPGLSEQQKARLAGLIADQEAPAAGVATGPSAPDDARSQAAKPASEGPALTREGVRERVARGESLTGEDLRGVDLSELNLEGADFSAAILGEVRLNNARLAGARFDRANLAGAELYGADLSKASLIEADLTGARLIKARLEEAVLDGAVLEGAFLRDVKGRGLSAKDAYACAADLRDAVLDRARLDGADLSRANLAGASAREASLRAASCEGASAQAMDLRGADLDLFRASEGADFSGATMQHTRGVDSIWADAVLVGADLSFADMPGADFTAASLEKAKLHAANLKFARLLKANCAHAQMTQLNLFQGSLEKADLTRADLRGSNLYGVEFLESKRSRTNTRGANLKRTKLAGES